MIFFYKIFSIERSQLPDLQFVISAPAPGSNLISAPEHCFQAAFRPVEHYKKRAFE
jgi:hypothetical protein